MADRKTSSPAADSTNPPEKFEDLLARLEQIVSDMESTDLPLEKLLASYEEGMKLVKVCGDRLTDADQKVEILSRAVAVEPHPVSPAPMDTAPSDPAGDDIRLF